MQHDDDRHPALPLAPLFDGQAPTLPHYGGVELVLDTSSIDRIMDADIMQLPGLMDEAIKTLTDLGQDFNTIPGYLRVIECHMAFIYFYAPSLDSSEMPRFWVAALDTALIWELG